MITELANIRAVKEVLLNKNVAKSGITYEGIVNRMKVL